MSTSALPRVPAEISDTIVDFLHDDEESLTNCSLVCKAWLPVTRYHIFRDLLLDRWNVEDFLNLITHPSANVAPYIRELAIDQVKCRYHSIFEEFFRKIPRFNLLQRLELRNISWTLYTPDAVASFIYAFQDVQELRLSKNTFIRGPEVFWFLITCFPLLQKLSITGTRLDWPTESGPMIPIEGGILTHLRVLELGYQVNGMFIRWLTVQRVIVDSLSIYVPTVETTTFNQYLRLLGASLVHLTLKPDESLLLWTAGLNDALDLSSNTRLRTLHFGNPGLATSELVHVTIPSVLSTLQSPCLNEVTFDFDAFDSNSGDRQWPESSDWRPLCRLLSQIRSISAIHLIVRGLNQSPSFEDIKSQFSRSNNPGILQIHFQDVLESRSSSPQWRSRMGNLSGPYCITNLQDTQTK